MSESVETEAARPPRTPIPILRYSTDHLPPDARYEDWSRRDWPRNRRIYRTVPSEPFSTRWESAQLGPVIFVRTEISAMRWERRLDDIRASDFDPIVVSMMEKGVAQGEVDGQPFRQADGMLYFHDLGRPSLHVSTASLTSSLIVPRPLAEARFGPLANLTGVVLPPDAAAMAFAYAAELHRALPRLDLAHADRLGEVFLEILAFGLAQHMPHLTPPLSAEQSLRARAAEVIDQRMGGGEIPVAELCKALGVTRGRLFSAFRSEGGVAACVMGRRLARAKAAIAERGTAEPIGTIAHRLGFSDASHLSREFRKRFGMTPSEYRRLAREDVSGER